MHKEESIDLALNRVLSTDYTQSHTLGCGSSATIHARRNPHHQMFQQTNIQENTIDTGRKTNTDGFNNMQQIALFLISLERVKLTP